MWQTKLNWLWVLQKKKNQKEKKNIQNNYDKYVATHNRKIKLYMIIGCKQICISVPILKRWNLFMEKPHFYWMYLPNANIFNNTQKNMMINYIHSDIWSVFLFFWIHIAYMLFYVVLSVLLPLEHEINILSKVYWINKLLYYILIVYLLCIKRHTVHRRIGHLF